VFISPEEADLVLVQDFPGPPPVVWDWLNDPYKRNQWGGGVKWTAVARPGGRTGVGARNHCAHGKGLGVETVVDWRPFDYVTAETLDGGMKYVETIRLEPLPDGNGTRIHDHIRLTMPWPRWVCRLVVRFAMLTLNKYDRLLQNSARLLADELGREPASA
jgi:uncharacterized protein YndB with AHSA1/START domain